MRENKLKTSAIILILMAALGMAGAGLAQFEDPPVPEPVLLTDSQNQYPLGLHMEILEDPGGELTIEEVASPEFDSQFTPSHLEVPNYGFTDSVYWVRFGLENQTQYTGEWLLEQGFANTHYLDLYTPKPDSAGFSVKQTGVLRPTSTRDVINPHIVFSLVIPPGSQQAAYLRFQSGGSMTLPLTLWTRPAFMNHALGQQTLMGIFFGVMFGLLFYNLFLLFTLREANYLFFVILLASVIFEDASYSGYLFVYIIPDLNIPVQYVEPVALPLMMGSMVLFADSFLDLKRRLPKLHAVSLVILTIWGGLVLLIPFTSYHILANLMAPWSVVSLVSILVAGIISWIGGYRPSRFFMLAWLGLVASLVWVFLVRLGLAPSSFLSENAFRFGYLWMAVCWSLALSDRINLLKAETEHANIALRENELRLSQILEGLPIGVVLYRKDHKPDYVNRRTAEILNNLASDTRVDVSAGRTLAEAIQYFSLKIAGRNEQYPLENFPIYRALYGEAASADDIEVDQGERRLPIEIWASPIRDDAGNVESAVVAFQDISQRKQAEAELDEYRKQLESLVDQKTTELSVANEQLQLRLDWLSGINLVNQVMARSADFKQIYDKIIEIINNLFAVHGTFIARFVEDGKKLKVLDHGCGSDFQPDLVGTFISLPENILSGANMAMGKFTHLAGEQLDSMDGPLAIHIQEANIHSLVLVPLRLREQIFGILGLEILDRGKFITSDETNLLNIFSSDIAQLIEVSRLFDQSRELILSEERSRLARDLHDSVTQTLFTASVLAESTPRIWDKDQKLARLNMEKLSLLIRGALAEMRSLLLELRLGQLHDQNLSQLLTALAEASRIRTQAEISLSMSGDGKLPDNVTLNYYYIAREALNNAIHHGKATAVDVSLLEEEDLVELRIQDDGRGFNPHDIPEGHLGINIMLERAERIGANLRIKSEPGLGTEVILTWSGKKD